MIHGTCYRYLVLFPNFKRHCDEMEYKELTFVMQLLQFKYTSES